MTGHADSGDYGHDIVCAAVSALAITTVNSLEALVHVTPTVDADQQNGGHLVVSLPQMSPEQRANAQLLLDNLRLGLSSIQEQYEPYLTVSVKS